MAEKQGESIEKSVQRRIEREKEYEAPVKNSASVVAEGSATGGDIGGLDLEKIKDKFNAGNKRKDSDNTNVEDFVEDAKPKKKKKKEKKKKKSSKKE